MGARQPALDGARPDVEGGGHLSLGEVEVVPEHHCGPLVLGQAAESLPGETPPDYQTG